MQRLQVQPKDPSTTITWTARISALRREHRSEELAQCLPVAFFLANDLVGCIIATIGLPDSKGLILKPASELDPHTYVGRHGQS